MRSEQRNYMYIQYYSYANIILILTVHGINCKDEREHGKSVIMFIYSLLLSQICKSFIIIVV